MRKGNRKWNLLDRVGYGIFFIAMGAMACFFQLSINLDIENGVKTTAVVTDSYLFHSNGKTHYHLYVEYDVNDEKYNSRIRTNYKDFEQLKDGGTITIYYNPSNPTEARSTDGYGNYAPYVLGVMSILLGVACFFIKE